MINEAQSFNGMFSSFCESYSASLSAFTGETIEVGSDLYDLQNILKNRSRALRWPPLIAPSDGPQNETISATLKGKNGEKKKSVTVFECTKDQLTGFPCSLEYNGKSVLCNNKNELMDALSNIPAERSAYVLKGLNVSRKNGAC